MLVEDDPKVRRSLNDALEDEGCRVRAVADAESGLSEMAAFRPDLVISDIRMPGLSGLELLELIKERAPDIDVVLMTAFEDMPTVARAMREGASDFLVKPLELSKLRELIQRVERDGRGRDEGAARSSPATGSAPLLVGRSPEIVEVYKLIGRVAASRVTALIRGETGTGKELVARAIHESSAYAEEPFVPVNCTALPETLLESELFGHVKGAFTGATSHRRGRFAMAQKGRSSWTRSATPPRRSNRSCCACSRTASSSRSVPKSLSRRTPESWRPRTGISKHSWHAGASEKTCTIGFASWSSASRHCGSD